MAKTGLTNKDSATLKHFGTVYGGFYYPENLDKLDENSVIYCFGAGEDITHDITVANQLNSKIYQRGADYSFIRMF